MKDGWAWRLIFPHAGRGGVVPLVGPIPKCRILMTGANFILRTKSVLGVWNLLGLAHSSNIAKFKQWWFLGSLPSLALEPDYRHSKN